MLISALNEYYAILQKKNIIPPPNTSIQKITHMIMLNKDGTVEDIVEYQKNVKLPKRTEKPAIDLNIIEHRPTYIFGLNYDKKTGKYSAKDKTCKAEKSHKCFVQGNLEFTENMTTPIVKAFRNFMEKWIPENEVGNEILSRISGKYQTASMVFALSGHPEIQLHDMDGEIMQKVLSQTVSIKADGICSVTGELDEIARIHDKIRGVKGVNSTGGTLVCYKNSAEESYSKLQSYNSSIGQNAMKHYTQSLNYLLSSEHHRMYIDEVTIVFWAMSANDSDVEENLFERMIGQGKVDADEMNAELENAVNELTKGEISDLSDLNIDENVMFYIVGLSPNVSRISQKFIYRNKFGVIFNNVIQHQKDILIDGHKGGQVAVWRICNELKSPNSSNDKIAPPVFSAIFSAILNNTKYPTSMFVILVRRCKIDKDVNYIKAGLIKAYINRKARVKNQKEEIDMSLNCENKNQAYLCGRLFAVLEKIQMNAAQSELNKTIKQYFSSACANPASVFPKLMRLTQYHLQKDEYAKYNDKLMGDIMDDMGTAFPKTLSLDDQGKFILGYYQQKQDLFKPKNKEND